MNKQKQEKTYEDILFEWLEIGYKIICYQEDALDMKIILGRQLGREKEFVIITVNYATLETNTITLDKTTVELMYCFGKER